MPPILGDFAQLEVDGFDLVCDVDDLAWLHGKVEEWDELLPRQLPHVDRSRVSIAELAVETLQRLFCARELGVDDGLLSNWVTPPDTWPTLLVEAGFLSTVRYPGTSTDFLVDSLTGRDRWGIFPDDFPSEVPTFVPAQAS
jgi:hypothetical protein